MTPLALDDSQLKVLIYCVSVVPVQLLFFFQAEDGIRYHCVTGVQTCALPICRPQRGRQAVGPRWTPTDSSDRRRDLCRRPESTRQERRIPPRRRDAPRRCGTAHCACVVRHLTASPHFVMMTYSAVSLYGPATERGCDVDRKRK